MWALRPRVNVSVFDEGWIKTGLGHSHLGLVHRRAWSDRECLAVANLMTDDEKLREISRLQLDRMLANARLLNDTVTNEEKLREIERLTLDARLAEARRRVREAEMPDEPPYVRPSGRPTVNAMVAGLILACGAVALGHFLR